MILRDVERHLLEKLAAEGKTTKLFAEDLALVVGDGAERLVHHRQ